MTAFLIYLLKSAGILGVFYLFYRLLLHKETFYGLNRALLLGIGVLALGLPFCEITFHKYILLPSALTTSLQTPVADAAAGAAAPPVWPVVVLAAYGLGVLVKFGHTCVSVFSVWRLVRRGRRLPQHDGTVLVVTPRRVAPFSWMRYIVLSEADYAADSEAVRTILLHERAHIRKRHSWDLLFVDGLLCLQWFNPAVWFLRRDLCALHEYEADAAVLRSGIDARQYQYLLLDKMMGGNVFALTDRFNQTKLKNRIAMMLSSKSARGKAWKALYLLPFIGLTLAANAKTVVEFQPIVIDMPNLAALQPSAMAADTQPVQIKVVRAPSAALAVTKSAAKQSGQSVRDTQRMQIMVVPSEPDTMKTKVLSVKRDEKAMQMQVSSKDDMLVMTLAGDDTAAIAVSFVAVKDTLNAILSAPSQFSRYLATVIKNGLNNLFDVVTVQESASSVGAVVSTAAAADFDFGMDGVAVYIDGEKRDAGQLASLSATQIANVNVNQTETGYTVHITTNWKTKR